MKNNYQLKLDKHYFLSAFYPLNPLNPRSNSFYYKKSRHDRDFFVLYINIGINRMIFDELSARRNLVAHEHTENMISFSCIFNGNLS